MPLVSREMLHAARLLQMVRQNVGGHRGRSGQDDGALDYIFQFAHIARPIVLHQDLHGFGLKAQERSGHRLLRNFSFSRQKRVKK